MAENIRIFHGADVAEWQKVLTQVGAYDFYHLPEYHTLHKHRGDGDGFLIVYQEDNKIIALPLLIRGINSIPGLDAFTNYHDATSVYGYPGPIANEQGRNDPAFLARFARKLESYAREQGWISVFSRLNPLLANHQLLPGLGEVIGLSDTVTIDLSIPPEEQTARYRKSHRYEIRRARRKGMDVYIDTNWESYASFVEMYLSTMKRVQAASHYFFDQTYFDDLRIALRERLRLFVARMDGQICAASLFVLTSGIIQYHLSASNEHCLKWAPSKLIIDEARRWGVASGARWLHLGGGVGSREDALFRFKAGFSPLRRRFCIWKWIVQPEAYEQLARQRQHWLEAKIIPFKKTNYFPAYRIETL